MLEKVAKNLAAQQAKRSQHDVHGVKITLFDVPKKDDKPARQVAYFLHAEMLAGADNLKVMEGMAGRIGQESKDSLAASPAFAAVMQRCRKDRRRCWLRRFAGSSNRLASPKFLGQPIRTGTAAKAPTC